MAKKPDAARGKTTRIGKIKKIIKGIKAKPKTVGMGMSPGAMGGRTKRKMPDSIRRPLTRTPMSKQGMVPMAGQAMKLARQLKKTGRLSVDDLMRAKKMMMGKGK